jgi:hypothetical protein
METSGGGRLLLLGETSPSTRKRSKTSLFINIGLKEEYSKHISYLFVWDYAPRLPTIATFFSSSNDSGGGIPLDTCNRLFFLVNSRRWGYRKAHIQVPPYAALCHADCRVYVKGRTTGQVGSAMKP